MLSLPQAARNPLNKFIPELVQPRKTKALLGGAWLLLCLGAVSCATITGSDPGARTPGVILDDQGIERSAGRVIREASEALRTSSIVVTSFNGVVLLTGLVSDESLKREAQTAVEQIRKARKIHNEIEVGVPVTSVSRVNDGFLSGKVKASLFASDEVNGDRVKVVTRNGVVYLMGLVSEVEGDSAANVARSVVGVQKVVKTFEYIVPSQ